jgi:uncharacterized protein (DUF2252 family)
MLQSPFTFYQGSAGVMAADLAQTPATGTFVQACGDAHLLNFGGFATPERRLIFDINDLDEPSQWGWDLKRLVASFVLAARSNAPSDQDSRDAAVACAASYRQAMRDFTAMDVLDICMTAIFSRGCRRTGKQFSAGESPRRCRAAVRSWCFRSSWKRPARILASTMPLRRSSVRTRPEPPATWP